MKLKPRRLWPLVFMACAVLLPAGACDDAGDITGQYILLGVDGIDVRDYTMENSAGTLVTAAGGGLDLCSDDRYRMTVSHRDENGKQRIVVSSGEYRWFGVTLMLLDSGDLAPMTASVEGGLIILQIDDHEFEFLKLVQLPPANPPDCGP